ncbi:MULTISPECIES: hypothetical protein [Rhizobium]|uniref:hypothetical protein n=1 Tax=Rhizobium TaxID=379 RepID=UPI00102FDBE0|nr:MULTISPECIES: hypothetical protein [Rhizobium]MDV4153859.1 hypothetical protein [Rhizobium brockwellii]TAY85627.1 hypothetical protein ELH79_30480 [Rhizobium leguminosarum]TAZ03074.1 hypothetical protein ELH78_31355 [Rhizobium leguminosarum]
MGEARHRRQSYDTAKRLLLDRHEGHHRIVAEVAVNLFDRFILPRRFTGACYQITMTLEKYLFEAHGISSNTVVGYVNDGTDDIMISHAWLEFDGKKVDLGLHFVDHPDVVRPGAVIVLNEQLRLGAIEYSYHLTRPAASLAFVEQMLKDPSTAHVARRKEAEHQAMLARSRDSVLRDIYLAGAPADSSFASMTSVLW